MKKLLQKVSKKTILISSILIVLIGTPILAYFFTREQAEDTSAWYSSSWMYRRAITVNNSGGTLTDEDVLINLDTATLISGNKLLSNCNDLRFVDSNDSTLLQYWIEDDCNTSDTKIWVRIPSLPSGGKTIYVYYGNNAATQGSLSWSGHLNLYTDTTCPSGWTLNSSLEGRFAFGSNTYGTTTGSASHSHPAVSCSSSSISTTNIGGSPIQGIGTGGTISTWDGYTIHTFTSNGTLTLPTATDSIEFLIVGGGGGGGGGGTAGNEGHGGGGGGGLLTSDDIGTISLSAGSYSIVIGSGGSQSSKGGNSSAFGYTAEGGGFGGFTSSAAGSGGSGGGGRGYSGTQSGGAGNAGPPRQGYAGGTGNWVSGQIMGGGGGGGAGNTGGAGTSSVGGAGGVGRSISITGSAIFYAGGGGGARDSSAGTGGNGGGGNGATGTTGSGGAGTANRGGGGGGAGRSGGSGGAGGSGIVIVRFTEPTKLVAASPTHTHMISNASVTNSSHIPEYTTVIFGKANSSTYVTEKNVLMATELPPLGWTRFVDLDGRYIMGSDTYGTTGGSSTHNHGVAIYSGGPSGTVEITQRAAYSQYYADSSHAHSCTANTDTHSNAPPSTSTLFIKRKLSKDVTVESEESLNTPPAAPIELLTEGQTNPSRVTDLTPEFSALFNDPDTSDTGVFYQIQVNTSSAFDGTTMWDSTKTAISPITNGQRSTDISYNGTALSLNGETYYWRIKFWDQNPLNNESPWSATAAFTMNRAPTAPTDLLTESSINPIKVYDTTPEFSAVFNDPDTGDTGIHYQIQVSPNPAFSSHIAWDSAQTSISAIANGARSSDISYAGSSLDLDGTLYYWRIKFWDNNGTESPWSSAGSFRMSSSPSAPTNLKVDGRTNPSVIDSARPTFYATHIDVNEDNAISVEINVNSNASFTGTVKWNTGKVSIDPLAHGAEFTVTYGGTQLLGNGTTYYWRIRFWDVDDNVSPWSATATFVDLFKYTRMNGIGLDGLRIN